MFDGATTVLVEEGADAAEGAVALLRGYLIPSLGVLLPSLGASNEPNARVIVFTSAGADDLGDEGYELRIAPDRVEVVAQAAAGFGWAVQTIRQLLPAEIESSQRQPGTFGLPAGIVRDVPRFGWRGVMLDVARHFLPPAAVERVIDLLAAYKLNHLHMHLTDDQGWRLEIQKYPELTAIGGSTAVGGGPGGYYTQDEYRRLVVYAAKRGILVVPEIDMPGHTNAALASLPWLNSDGVAREPYTGAKVGFSSLCVDREQTYEFVDHVIDELAQLTPAPYVHIGGDESDATEAEGYRRFLQRAADIVRSHGKRPVAWEDAAVGDLGRGALVQHWKYPDRALAGAAQGAGVVMSPAARTYLDMKYDPATPAELGITWAGTIDTRAAYQWDPASHIPDLHATAVLGLEAPLWTETVTTLTQAEQMLLPRLPGYAEIGWSPAEGRSWGEYRRRLATHAARWTSGGRSFTSDPVVPWPDPVGSSQAEGAGRHGWH